MKGKVYKPKCKCPKDKKGKKGFRCKCPGNWGYLVDIGPDPTTGKRRQRGKFIFKTKREAEAALVGFLTELNQGNYIEETDITFEEFSKEWLLDYASTGKVKKGTVRVRSKELNRLLDYFAKLKMKNITGVQYQNALKDMKKRGYADNTMDGIHVTGGMIFKKAFKKGIIKKNPTEDAYVPREQKTVKELENEKNHEIPKYLEKEELALFLTTAEEKGLSRDYPAFLTLSHTGMRIGELCALQWKDIDFQNGTISITKTYINEKNNIKQYDLDLPKNKKARTIAVDEVTLEALKKYKEHQNKIKIHFREVYYDQDYVFAEESKKYAGYPTYPKKFNNRMTRLLKMTNLNNDLSLHSFRHIHTSILAELGFELIEIMDRLGHTKDETTVNVYLHVTKGKKKETANKFSELIRGLR